jgi:AraC-like DNA-binding protein
MPSVTKIIVEISFVEACHSNDLVMLSKCKELFTSMIREFSPKPVSVEAFLKDAVRAKNGVLPGLISLEDGKLRVNNSAAGAAWPDPVECKFITKCVEVVIDNLDNENFNTYLLAEIFNLSKASLYRRLRSLSGFTIKYFIRMVKMQAAHLLLSSGNFTVSEVSWRCGYSSPRHFSKIFYKLYEVRPSKVASSRLQ